MQYFTPYYDKQILLINHLKYIMQIQTEKKQTEITTLYIYLLGNPALPRLLKITPAVYPHLNDFTGKLNFRD